MTKQLNIRNLKKGPAPKVLGATLSLVRHTSVRRFGKTAAEVSR